MLATMYLATLAALYPATKPRSPRAYGVILSTVYPAGNETLKDSFAPGG
jgi:hypothetical protein